MNTQPLLVFNPDRVRPRPFRAFGHNRPIGSLAHACG
jgi:hypothetical protein